MLAHLPELLSEPIAIIQSETRPHDGVVALVDATINGKQTIMPVSIQTTAISNGVTIDSNHLSSAYGKDNAVRLFENAVEKENANKVGVYYLDKNRASNLIGDGRLQLPAISEETGLIHSIFDAGSPVNRKYLEQTETSLNFQLLLYNVAMNILQQIFSDHYEEIKYTLRLPY